MDLRIARCRLTPGRVRRIPADLLTGAPATLTWLALVAFTTFLQLSLSERRVTHLLRHASTNLANLLNLRLPVLAASAFWLDSDLILPQLAGWALVFVAVLAPAERWLGTRRWLVAVLIAHVGATVFAAGRLWILIRLGRQPGSLVSAIDVGVSYGVLGIVGLSTYRFPHRWRWPYAAALAVLFVVILRIERDFVSAGHVAALFIGFACYPLAASAPGVRVRMGFAHISRYTLPDMRRSAPKAREDDEG